MGHREDLLAGAKRCLYERGYARTTARDIVAASGTNLASIGYHFGSKESLLDLALQSAIRDWGAEMRRALATDLAATATPAERFLAAWTRVVESFANHRQLWVASVEALAQAERSPQVRAFLGDALQTGRERLIALFQGGDAPPTAEQSRTVGSIYQALMTGIGVQWLIDPDRAPSARDLAAGMAAIAACLEPSAPVDGRRSRGAGRNRARPSR